jgi:hypothetical protein
MAGYEILYRLVKSCTMSLMDSDDGQNQKPGDAAAQNDLTPDQAVSLRQAEPAAPVIHPAEPAATTAPATVVANPQPTPLATAGPASVPAVGFVADVAEAPHISPFDSASLAETLPQDSTEISWTASEFIAHPKSMNWYLALAGITVVLVALAYLLNHDIITILAILIAAGLFGYMASRQPRQLEYSLGATTINIGARAYPYKDFNAFSIVTEGPFSSIDFMPLKRFAPILSIYYDPNQEPAVMEALSRHLPIAHHKRTAIDNFMHRIRF